MATKKAATKKGTAKGMKTAKKGSGMTSGSTPCSDVGITIKGRLLSIDMLKDDKCKLTLNCSKPEGVFITCVFDGRRWQC